MEKNVVCLDCVHFNALTPYKPDENVSKIVLKKLCFTFSLRHLKIVKIYKLIHNFDQVKAVLNLLEWLEIKLNFSN